MKKLLTLVLVAFMALTLVGCGSKETATETTVTPEASGSNYLNVMIEVEVESLDAQEATDGTSFEVIADFTDGLMQMDADGAAVNALAKDVTVSEDGTVYTFTIRDDAYWSNGDPVTAHDFVFGWRRLADPAMAAEYNYMISSEIANVKNADAVIAGNLPLEELGVKALDDKTLEVTLDVPVSFFLSLMYFPSFYPVNEKFYNSLAAGTYGTSADTVLSNGAFILEDYSPSALSFSLKKNENYYDADKVSLDGLKYQVIKDSQQALMNYQNGGLDITKVSGEQIEQIEGDPELNVVGAGYLWYLTMNGHDVEALSNPNVRLAITNAVDRVAIVKSVVKDGSLPTYTPVPPQFAASSTDGSDFSADQTRYSEYCSDDAAKAAEFWAKGKEEVGFTSLELELLCEDQTETQNVAAVLKSQLEAALDGLTVNIKVEPKKQRVADIQDGNYEVCLTRWGPDYADPMTYLGMWVTDNNNNYGLWSSAEYDAIIKDCTTGAYVSDYDARWAALYDATEIVMKEAVIAPIYTKADANMIKANVKGIEFHPVALNRVFKNTVKD